MTVRQVLKFLAENYDSMDDEVRILIGHVEDEDTPDVRVVITKDIEISGIHGKGLVIDRENL